MDVMFHLTVTQLVVTANQAIRGINVKVVLVDSLEDLRMKGKFVINAIAVEISILVIQDLVIVSRVNVFNASTIPSELLVIYAPLDSTVML